MLLEIDGKIILRMDGRDRQISLGSLALIVGDGALLLRRFVQSSKVG